MNKLNLNIKKYVEYCEQSGYLPNVREFKLISGKEFSNIPDKTIQDKLMDAAKLIVKNE